MLELWLSLTLVGALQCVKGEGGSRRITFENKCGYDVTLNCYNCPSDYNPWLQWNGQPENTFTPTISGSETVYYTVAKDLSNLDFWFSTSPSQGTLSSTRAIVTYPPEWVTQSVVAYDIMPDAYTLDLQITPKDTMCKTATVQKNSNGLITTIGSISDKFYCSNMENFTITLCQNSNKHNDHSNDSTPETTTKANIANTLTTQSPNKQATTANTLTTQSPNKQATTANTLTTQSPNKQATTANTLTTQSPNKQATTVASNTPPTNGRYINYINNCLEDIWIQIVDNSASPSILARVLYVPKGKSNQLIIPDAGWVGRSFTKGVCDNTGNYCKIGQSLTPCGPCAPAAQLYLEPNFEPIGSVKGKVWYDISAVDGFDKYSLMVKPVKSTPYIPTGSTLTDADFKCNTIAFALNPNSSQCPTETNFMQISATTGKTVASLQSLDNNLCMSPCQKAGYDTKGKNPFAWGYGMNIYTEYPATHYCCSGGDTAEFYHSGAIKNTAYWYTLKNSAAYNKYVYSYPYDDEDATYTCPATTSLDVTVCPNQGDLDGLSVAPGQSKKQ